MEKHSKKFYLKDGKTLTNLKDFAKALMEMKSDIFSHHVNKEKHDFANWINHSLKKENLAQKIEKSIDKVQIELEILRHLVYEEVKKTNKKSPKKIIKTNSMPKIAKKIKTTPKSKNKTQVKTKK